MCRRPALEAVIGVAVAAGDEVVGIGAGDGPGGDVGVNLWEWSVVGDRGE